MKRVEFNNEKYRFVVGDKDTGPFFQIWHQPVNELVDEPAVDADRIGITIFAQVEEPRPEMPRECSYLVYNLSKAYADISPASLMDLKLEVVDAIARSLGFAATEEIRQCLA